MESLNRVYEALGILRDRVPRLVDCLALEPAIDLAAWQNALDSKLLPRFSPEFPLIVAVAGGGSSGKSTLFNALLGADVSPTGPTAGLTRRVLVGMNPRLLERSDFLCELFQPFRSLPEPLTDAAQAKVPGPPLYVTSPQLPGNLRSCAARRESTRR